MSFISKRHANCEDEEDEGISYQHYGMLISDLVINR